VTDSDDGEHTAALSMGTAEPGIREVARHAGVSIGTVSNVLNRPEKVSGETRRRVDAAIAKLDFIPNRPAAVLRSGRSRMIGLIVPDLSNPFFTEVARGAEDAASTADYAVVLCNSDERPEKEEHYLSVLQEQRVAGVFLTPLGPTPVGLARMRDRGCAVVLLDRAAKAREYCSVSVDDVRGGQVALDHLLSLHPSGVALVNGPVSLRQCADRRRGARQALAKAGSPRDALIEISVESMTIAAGMKAAERLLGMTHRPSAVFCTNDLLAIGLERTLTQNGLRIPDDIALVGYDDIDLAANVTIPLTSIRQPQYELGRAAGDLLLKEIRGGTSHVHERIVFQPHLVPRASTAPTYLPHPQS